MGLVFYKNMESAYVERFLKYGEVLLRPLSFFRASGDVRQDDLEGLRGLRIQPTRLIETSSEEFWTPENVIIRSARGRPVPITLHRGSSATSQEILPDAYIFSVSEERNPKFGGSAYKIVDPNQFGRGLLRALRRNGEPITGATFARVAYGSYKDIIETKEQLGTFVNEVVVNSGLAGCFVKPTTPYREEKEWRFLFVLNEGATAKGSMLITSYDLVKFTEPV